MAISKKMAMIFEMMKTMTKTMQLTKKLRKIAFILLASVIFPFLSFAEEPQGYFKLPSQEERQKNESGYFLFPEFSPIDIVEEETGRPNLLLSSLIKNKDLKEKIESAYFNLLQIRDLSIAYNRIYYSSDSYMHYPFIASIKYARGSQNIINGNQGTIDVAGEVIVNSSHHKINILITSFYDSELLERVARKLGFNEEINLNFASSLLAPQLHKWFTEEPKRIDLLVGTINMNTNEENSRHFFDINDIFYNELN